jgi:hypothetical protein
MYPLHMALQYITSGLTNRVFAHFSYCHYLSYCHYCHYYEHCCCWCSSRCASSENGLLRGG